MNTGEIFALVQLVFWGSQIESSSGLHASTARCRRPDMQTFVARACNGFGMQVYHDIDHSGNVVVSPASICTVLAVSMTFTKNTTLSELKRQDLFKWTTKLETARIFRYMFRSFEESHDVNITANNVLFFDGREKLVPHTVKVFKKYFNGTLVSFNPTEREEADTAINDYLLSSTEGLADDLQADSITYNQALVLVNTMKLEARWKGLFKKSQTSQMVYHVDNTTTILVPMMYRRGTYRWNRSWTLKCDVIEIPYEGDRFFMYIILPHDKYGIETLENKFMPRSTNLRKLISNMDEDPITTDLYLPKFSIRHTLNLNDVLVKAGITSLLDKETADLSGLVEGARVYVDRVLHQSAIDVNEMGTVAGTYSKISLSYYSSHPTFNANHPFLYVLHDTETEFNLFMGKFTRP